MENGKCTEAQKRASRKWREKNKDNKEIQIKGYKRTAKTYIRHYATDKDMIEFNQLYKDSKKEKNKKNF